MGQFPGAVLFEIMVQREPVHRGRAARTLFWAGSGRFLENRRYLTFRQYFQCLLKSKTDTFPSAARKLSPYWAFQTKKDQVWVPK